MGSYLIGYSIIGLLIIVIVFSILVKHGVLFGNSPRVRKVFAHPLLHYAWRRLGSSLISLVLVIIVTFFLIRLASPADETCVRLFKTPRMSEETFDLLCNNWKESMGFEGSTIYQLGMFFYKILPIPKLLCISSVDTMTATYTVTNCRAFIFDFGRIWNITGFTYGGYVTDYIWPKMGVSFEIGIIAVVLEMGLGYPFGILMAKYQNGTFDKIGKAYIISVDAIPGIAYYYIWMALLCSAFMLPTIYDEANFASWLPAILTMGFTGMAGIGMWVRRYMLDQFNADYVKFARSKGLSESRILWIHILRNAIVPLVRTFPTAVLGALLGTYYLENIYAIPGLGESIMVSINSQDWSLLSGIIIISSLVTIIAYLLGDVVTAAVDPRISLTKE